MTNGELETTMQLPSAHDDLKLICEAAIAAGDLALPYFRGAIDLEVQMKVGNSPVSAADYAVNAYLMTVLKKARPDYGWLSEETLDEDKSHRMAAQRTFVVDPIDGTRGFIEGRDQWCISVAVVEQGRPIAGALVCPARSEIYTAVLGAGAALNGKPLNLPRHIRPKLVIGGPRIYADAMDANTDIVFSRHGHVPSLAYRIAMVASGLMDGTFVKPHAHDWDVAAADLILSEAGGVLVDENGANFIYNMESSVKPVMIASHIELAKAMLGIVAQTPFS